MTHICNPWTWEVEAGRSRVWDTVGGLFCLKKRKTDQMKSQLVKYLLYVKDDEAEVLFYSTVAAEKPSWTHSCASFPGLGIHKVYLKKNKPRSLPWLCQMSPGYQILRFSINCWSCISSSQTSICLLPFIHCFCLFPPRDRVSRCISGGLMWTSFKCTKIHLPLSL